MRMIPPRRRPQTPGKERPGEERVSGREERPEANPETDRERPPRRRRRNPSPEREPRRSPDLGLPGCQARTLTIVLLAAAVVLLIVQQILSAHTAGKEITYTEFWSAVRSGRVAELTIVGRQVLGSFRAEGDERQKRFNTYLPSEPDDELLRLLREGDPEQGIPPIPVKSKPEPTPWFSVFITWLPFLLLVGLIVFMIRQMQAGGAAALKFGKSRAKVLTEHTVHVTFDDVAGADEAKQELQEVIEFLRDPRKFQRLGGRIPKGVLLLGPPGTGKTLLARAVAGEAGVPFFSISGSDFVEMFVGVGAARVRDLFEQGKRNAPCIIFVDEIDAVGRHRGAGLGGGHDEREQTLNQLLVEMDGFDSNEGVILLAATNRPDVLDPALLRPGRFDRQVVVDRPDLRGREGILRVHTRGKPLADDVDLHTLARGTPGLSGADLANLVNEAALLAARKNRDRITMADFEEAKDKVMMGTERRSLIIPEKERRITAYHEAGHALVSWFLPETDPIHKVTVIPRGRALGVTHSLPSDDRYVSSKDYLEQTMAALMGGRVAEEEVLNTVTTGAASDIERATEIARKMVCEWGMSERLGPIQFGKRDELVFLGKEIAHKKEYSEETARMIDAETTRIVQEAYATAKQIIEDHRDDLHKLANALLEREILTAEDIEEIVGCKKAGTKEDSPEPSDAEETATDDQRSEEHQEEP